ncbi:M6 family metalloprotease domain-containing protein [Sporosarcina sp. NPDC096371]|uniref:M6 family metalloprotease domain-containing protein n=1 Tax=Sporosarcina sp. NPDC096371 TaxID=3364530 RepID=UPI00381D6A2F
MNYKKLRNRSAGLFAALILMATSSPAYAQDAGLNGFPEPVDPESWVLPEDMTWADYKAVPGIDWRDTDIKPERVLKGALIIVDFQDREFILSQPMGSMEAGNPLQVGNVPRDEVGDFWIDFLNTPSELNNYRTIDEYWKENSYGKWGVELESFGTYRMDHNEFQYGMGEWGQEANMPGGFKTYNVATEALNKAKADMDASGEQFDFTFVLHAGYDESGVWQEFGEMMFNSPEAVTDEFGAPAEYPELANSAKTRYVPWTSWVAAKSLWSRAGSSNGMRYSIQGENDGMGVFAHEFGHIMALGDNYNNPYGIPVSRTYSGPWELMSRGSFNGPGGPHTRWMVLPTLGSSAPSHHMLRNKIKQGFLTEDQYLNIDRDGLAKTGPVFADILARSVPTGEEFGRTGLQGINIKMEDLTPRNYLKDDWRADMQNGAKWYNNYTVEVVDRVGFDSFTPDSGVLLAKTKNSESAPNIWVVDANPEDIDQVDFVRPNGEEAMYSKGDFRQLADSLFKAGTDEGVFSEYTDEHNRLHFYILDKKYDDIGALSYRVAVRHLDGAGSFERGVTTASSTVEQATPGRVATHNFSVTNTGEETDLIRVKAETAAGWKTQVQHNVIEVPAGETVEVPVYVEIPEGKQAPTNLVFTATSETDASKTATESNVLLNDISAAGIKALVERLQENGDITNATAARALTTHLTAVDRFEKQEAGDKVVKHMAGFKVLLEQQVKNGLITKEVSNTINGYAELLSQKW